MSERPEAPSDGSSLADLIREWSERLAALPEPISYIVIDPSFPHAGAANEHDAQGRRYLLVNSAVLDEMQHRNYGGFDLYGSDQVASLSAIPVYRRQDMPEGWPDLPVSGETGER